MDDYESFITEEFFTRNANRPKYVTRPCSFPLYTDDELLSLPADQIIAERRLTALGGREYICGDNAPTNWAVVRVPMEEATKEDFRPRLDWSDHNEARKPMVGKYKINRTLANKGIAPRVSEPSLPPQTQTSVYNASQENTPLQPIDRAMLRATQVIQLVKKGNGDYKALAKVLGKMWGNESLLDPDEETDTLGDISLPRVLAKRSKRRFEVYRNIGFTSIVSAGSTQASSKHYGDSSIINWQRRTELAKLFLHFAQALEGGELRPGQEFTICARIPEFTVMHRTWDDLGIACSDTLVTKTTAPMRYQTSAKSFLEAGVHTALRIVSESVRAMGGNLDISEQEKIVAAKYDKLTYYAPLAKDLERKLIDAELAMSKRAEDSLSISGTYKAHDVRVAVLELMASSTNHSSEVAHVVSALMELKEIDKLGPIRDKYGFYSTILRQLPIITTCAKLVATRPVGYELRHRRAEWARIAEHQIPQELIMESNPYNAHTIALSVLYTIHRIPSSQAVHTLTFISKSTRDVLKMGIKNRKEIVIKYGAQVQNTIHNEIWASNRRFYRERYRHRARIDLTLSQYGNTKSTRDRALLASAWWFARSDIAHAASLSTTDGITATGIANRKERAVYAIYLHKLRELTALETPKLSDMTIEDVRTYAETVVMPICVSVGSTHTPQALRDRIDDYFASQLNDYGTAHIEKYEELAKPVHEETVTASAMDEILNRPVPTVASIKYTIESMVSHWYSMSEINSYMDVDDLDDLIEWMEENISVHVAGVDSYIETHAKGETKKSAKSLMEFWIDLKEIDDEADQNNNEIY